MRDIEEAGDYSDQGPDYGTLAKLDRNDQTGLELHARLAGRLDSRPDAPTTNLHVYLGIPRLDPARVAPSTDVSFEALPPGPVGNKSGESE